MVKKQFFSIGLIVVILCLVWGISGVFASSNAQEQIETVTPTPTPMSADSLSQMTTFGSPELKQVFASGDGNKFLISYDNYLDIFDTEEFKYFDRFELPEEFDNSLLGVNENSNQVALQAKSGFYIFDPLTKIKSTSFESGNEGYSFYAFPPIGKTFLYGIHHSSPAGRSTDLILRGVDDSNNILIVNYLKPANAQAYFDFASPITSPDGEYLAAGYSDALSNRIVVWKTDAPEVLYEISDLPATVNTLAIDPDSETFASAGEDGIIRVWSLETGEFIESINGLTSAVSSIQYTDEGRVLNIITSTGKLFTYNFVSNQLIQRSASEEMSHPLLLQKIAEDYLLKNTDRGKSSPAPASLAFSPDGSKTAIVEGSVQIWDSEGGNVIANFLPDSRFEQTNISFDPAGERLAVLSNQGDLYVWNIKTGQTELHITAQRMLEKQEPFTLENVSNAVSYDLSDFSNNNIVFSPDGKQIAFANGMNVETWNVSLKARLKSLSADGNLGRPEKVTFSVDGESVIAVTNNDQHVLNWNLQDGEVIDQFDLTYKTEQHGAFTSIGTNYFVSLNNDGSETWIDLWNLQTKESTPLEIINDEIISSAFNASGTLFSAIDNQSTIYVWRTDTGQLLYYEKDFPTSGTLAINADNSILATAKNGQISYWNLQPLTEAGFQDNFVSPTLVPDVQNGGFTFTLGPTATPTPASAEQSADAQDKANTPQEPQVNVGEQTQDSDPVVANGVTPLLKTHQNPGIITSALWRSNTAWLTSTTGLYTYNVSKEDLSIAFTNEDMAISSIEGIVAANYLVAGMADKDQILLWNQQLSRQLFTGTGYSAPVVSSTKKWMVYYLGNNGYMLWNINKAQSGYILSGGEPSTQPVFSPNGVQLAIAQKNGLIQVWDAESGTIVRAFNADNAPCSHIQFSKDSKSLIGITDNAVWIWSLQNDDPPIVFQVFDPNKPSWRVIPKQIVTAADINYTNKIIAIADDSGTIRFYTIEDQNLYRNMSQPNYEIALLSFAPSNNNLLSVDINGQVSVWDADSSEPITEPQFFSGTFDGLRALDDDSIAAWTQNRVTIYDAETLEIQNEMLINAKAILDISQNGRWVAASSANAIEIFDIDSGDSLAALPLQSQNTEDIIFLNGNFSLNSEYFIAYGEGGAWIYLINANNIGNSSLLGNISADEIQLAELNSDGSRFILSTGEGFLRPKLYETSKQTQITEFQLAEYQTNLISGQEYSAYAFSPDQKQAILLRSGLYDDARLEIFNIANGQVVNYVTYKNTTANALAISSDGDQIAVGFDTGQIRIYSTNNLALLSEFYAHPGAVSNLVFSNNDEYLISTGEEGAIKSWIME
jgi:WD40 repeat protein